MKNKRFKAVIFDLDGTLLDTLEELGSITNTILETHGYPVHELTAYRQYVGNGAQMLITRALPDASKNEQTIHQCLNDFLDLYKQVCGEKVTVYPGIKELLEVIETTEIKMAILSNKPHTLTVQNAELFLSDFEFEVVFGERQGIPKKPDPAGALEISETLKIHPSEILYLGDTSVDMKTAVSAGMYPVGVLWGFRDREELEENGAKMTIRHPSELYPLLT